MIIEDLEAFAKATRGKPLAGLDLGTKTIGVAVCDPLWTVASPLETVRRTKFSEDAQALAKLLGSRNIAGIILGLPLNMDGSEGPRTQSTRAFARNLNQHALFAHHAIGFWDERLSTVAAERALLEADSSRKKRAQVIDHVAAGFILQGALDRLRMIQGAGD